MDSGGNVPSESREVKSNDAEGRGEDNCRRKCPGTVGALADKDEKVRSLVYDQISHS